jgi:DNA-binding LytR/AlgR family response regulator
MKFKLIIDKEQPESVLVTAHAPSALTRQIEDLVRQQENEDRLSGYSEEKDEFCMLPLSRIQCITVRGGKTYAVDADGSQYRLKQRLYELEAILPAYFIRINKSAIANEKALERFAATYSGAVDAVFRCGYREYVSRRCFSQIKRRFDL